MLAVGIECDDDVVSMLDGACKSGLERSTLPAILRMIDHFRTCRTRNRGGVVARSVIDDDDVRNILLRLAHDVADSLRGVERRNEHQRALGHAASRERTAHTIPPPAEIEFTSTWRSSPFSGSRVGVNRISGSFSPNPADACSV